MKRVETAACRRNLKLVAAHFGQRSRPALEAPLREHLKDCKTCRDVYDRYLLVSQLDPAAPSPRKRLGAGLGLATSRPRRGWVVSVAAAAATATVAAMIMVFAMPQDTLLTTVPNPGGFTPRGGDALVVEGTGIWIYELRSTQRVKLVKDRSVRHEMELAFAYENAAQQRHLLIFAVDNLGHVYWFAPLWTDGSQTPHAEVISRQGGVHELPQAVTHRFAGTILWLYCVFLDQPLTVREVESLVKELDRPGAKLPVPGSMQRIRQYHIVQ